MAGPDRATELTRGARHDLVDGPPLELLAWKDPECWFDDDDNYYFEPYTSNSHLVVYGTKAVSCPYTSAV
jgi:hypothetical protein